MPLKLRALQLSASANGRIIPQTRRMQRWVNNKCLFYSVKDFKDYDPCGYKKRNGQIDSNR